MAGAGFSTIRLSFDEAGDKVSLSDLARALECLERAGYDRSRIRVYMLVGRPSQSRGQVLDRVREVVRLGARPSLAEYSPVPGTAGLRDRPSSMPAPVGAGGFAVSPVPSIVDTVVPPERSSRSRVFR